MTAPAMTCIGCGQRLRWNDPRWVSDDNGETGCPACFTEDGSGECWNRHLLPAQVDTHPQGGDAKQAPGESLSSAVGLQADAPETPGPTHQTKEHTQ